MLLSAEQVTIYLFPLASVMVRPLADGHRLAVGTLVDVVEALLLDEEAALT